MQHNDKVNSLCDTKVLNIDQHLRFPTLKKS